MEPTGVSLVKQHPAAAIESVRGCSIYIEDHRYLVVRKTTRTFEDAQRADLSEALVIDLEAADDSAAPALLAFVRKWCGSKPYVKRSRKKGR
jgi:hypothetical protein